MTITRSRYKSMQANHAQKSDSSSEGRASQPRHTGNVAMAAVLETPELVEMILSELCMQDLLVNAQRTCKQWKSIIDESPKLQEALFFRPINSKRLVLRTTLHNLRVERASLGPDSDFKNLKSPVYEHPLVTQRHRGHFLKITGGPDASWRRQLITQPPLTEMQFWHVQTDRNNLDDRDRPGTMKPRSGTALTLGDFVDEQEKHPSFHCGGWGLFWRALDWRHTSAVANIEPARLAEYEASSWVAIENSSRTAMEDIDSSFAWLDDLFDMGYLLTRP